MGKRPGKPRFKPYRLGQYRLGWLVDQFVVTWTENGVRRRYRLGVATENEARTEIHSFARLRLAQKGEQGETIQAIYEQYLADREAEGKSVDNAGWRWKALAPTFGPLRPQDVTKKICRDYVEARKRLGRKPHTIHSELSILRTIVNWAGKARLIKHVPHVWMPEAPPPRDRHLTPEEVGKLLAAARLPHIRLFIVLALCTAARKTAILELTWNRIDFDRGRIYLRDPLVYNPGKAEPSCR